MGRGTTFGFPEGRWGNVRPWDSRRGDGVTCGLRIPGGAMGQGAAFGVSGGGNWSTSIAAVAVPLGFPDGRWGAARPSDSGRGMG